jgi:hypothetical protein
MKRAVIACALLLVGTSAAQAWHYDNTYYDLVRPHGKPRSDAIFQSNLDACYNQTGADRFEPDPPAFRQCMLARGYRFLHASVVHTRPPQGGDCFNAVGDCAP